MHRMKRRERPPSGPTKKNFNSMQTFDDIARRVYCAENVSKNGMPDELPKTKLERCPALTEEELRSRLQAFRSDQKRLATPIHASPPGGPAWYQSETEATKALESNSEGDTETSKELVKANSDKNVAWMMPPPIRCHLADAASHNCSLHSSDAASLERAQELRTGCGDLSLSVTDDALCRPSKNDSTFKRKRGSYAETFGVITKPDDLYLTDAAFHNCSLHSSDAASLARTQGLRAGCEDLRLSVTDDALCSPSKNDSTLKRKRESYAETFDVSTKPDDLPLSKLEVCSTSTEHERGTFP